MFFIPTFLRRSFSVQSLCQFSLTISLLSSALCLLVSSYTIEDSCKNYKGNDITADIERAINEVKEMADDAHIASISEELGFSQTRTRNLLDTLFGTDRTKHSAVVDLFEKVAALSPAADFVVICDDLEVKWEPDHFSQIEDPRGIFVSRRYRWIMLFDQFIPCNPARKPGGSSDIVHAYTVGSRLIYLCPRVLDADVGRSLAPYKDEHLAGRYIEDFANLPVILFHEILHTKLFDGVDAEVRGYPPQEDYDDPNKDVFDPSYVRSLPWEHAYGFSLCQKLALDDPDLAVRNCDSLALCAVGIYLYMNNWAVESDQGFATPL